MVRRDYSLATDIAVTEAAEDVVEVEAAVSIDLVAVELVGSVHQVSVAWEEVRAADLKGLARVMPQSYRVLSVATLLVEEVLVVPVEAHCTVAVAASIARAVLSQTHPAEPPESRRVLTSTSCQQANSPR